MKLYLNKASPYARLALATAHETALADRVETVWTEPWDDAPELLAVNPLAKVPALLTDDGIALIESGCICDYLVSLSGRDDLLPAPARARAGTLRRRDLGDLAVAVAFDYVDFRLPEIAWRTQSPGLAAWVDAVCARPSMQATRPR